MPPVQPCVCNCIFCFSTVAASVIILFVLIVVKCQKSDGEKTALKTERTNEKKS